MSNIDARPLKKKGGKACVQDTGDPPPVSQPCSEPAPVSNIQCGVELKDKFTNKLVTDLLFVEVCAGSARLTKTARDAGFNGIAIDHTSQRSDGVDICIFELEDRSQVRDLCNFLEEEAENVAAAIMWHSKQSKGATTSTTSEAGHQSAGAITVQGAARPTGRTRRH